jgi:hypothetical protein
VESHNRHEVESGGGGGGGGGRWEKSKCRRGASMHMGGGWHNVCVLYWK